MTNIFLSALLAVTIDVPADSINRNIQLDEVEVVASVRENGNMRQQPASYSIISRKRIEDSGIASLKDVTGMVPNFFMPDYGSRLTSAVYIRGIGSRMNTPAVGMYVDNVPYTDKSAFDFYLNDIERIDVLRGPQGALYGRNAMGGIVNVYTRNPFTYKGTSWHRSYNFKDRNSVASLSHCFHPTPRLAMVASGYYQKRKGLFTNSVTGAKADALHAGGGRLRSIFKATDRLTFDLTASYENSDEGAYPYFYTGQIGGEEKYADCIGKITANHEGSYMREMVNAGLNIGYQGKGWMMNAVTGYQYLRDRMFMDQDFIAADIYTLTQRQKINTITEELTFKSTDNGRWQWVSGVNVMKQWLRTEAPVMFFDDGIDWLAGLVNMNMPDVSKISVLSNMGFTKMAVNFRDCPMNLGGSFHTPLFNAAVFHQSTVRLGGGLSAIVGMRLNLDHHSLTYNAPASVAYGFTLANSRVPMMNVNLQNLTADLGYDGRMKNDYVRVLPKVALKWEWDSRNNVYVTVAEGMRSGGYNVQMFSELLQGAMRKNMMDGIKTGVADYLQQFTKMGMPSTVINSVVKTMEENMPQFDVPQPDIVVYKPEYSWNYELGTHLTLPYSALTLDAALYYIRTTDQQIARFAATGMGRQMVNAGESESIGAELSLKWMPVRSLNMVASYGFNQSKFTEYNDGSEHDYNGNYVPFVPRHTVNINADYTWFVNRKYMTSVTLGADYTGAGRIYWTEANDVSQKYYSLLGARLSMVIRRRTLTLWVRNITDTKYNTFYFQSASRGYEQHAKPFQIGFDWTVKI